MHLVFVGVGVWILTTCALFVICNYRGLLKWRTDKDDDSIAIDLNEYTDYEKKRRESDPMLQLFRVFFVTLMELVAVSILVILYHLFDPARSLLRLWKILTGLFVILVLAFRITTIALIPAAMTVILAYISLPPKLGILIFLHFFYVAGLVALCVLHKPTAYPFLYGFFALTPSLLVFRGISAPVLYLAKFKTVLAAAMVILCVAVGTLDQIEVKEYVPLCFEPLVTYRSPLELLIEEVKGVTPEVSPPPDVELSEVITIGSDKAPSVYVAPLFEFNFKESVKVGCYDLFLPPFIRENGSFTEVTCKIRCKGFTFAIIGEDICVCTHLQSASYQGKASSDELAHGCFWSLLSPCWFSTPQPHFVEEIRHKEWIVCVDDTRCSTEDQPCCKSSFVSRCALEGTMTQLCLDGFCRENCTVPQFCVHNIELECEQGYQKEQWTQEVEEEETLAWEHVATAFERCTSTKECCGVQLPSPWHIRERNKYRLLPCRNFMGTLCRKPFLEYFSEMDPKSCDLTRLDREWKSHFTVTFNDYNLFSDNVWLSTTDDGVIVDKVVGDAWKERILPKDRLIALVPHPRSAVEKRTGVEFGWKWTLHLLRPEKVATRSDCYEKCAESPQCQFFSFGSIASRSRDISIDYTISDVYFQRIPPPEPPLTRHYDWYREIHSGGILKPHTWWNWVSLPSRTQLAQDRLRIASIDGVDVSAETVNSVFQSVVVKPDVNATRVPGQLDPRYQVHLRLELSLAPEESNICRTFTSCDTTRDAVSLDNLEEGRTFKMDTRGRIRNSAYAGLGKIGANVTCPNATVKPSATYLSKGDCFAQCEAAQCISAVYGEVKRQYLPLEGECFDDLSALQLSNIIVTMSTPLRLKVRPNLDAWMHGNDHKGGEGVLVSIDASLGQASVRWDWQRFDEEIEGYSIATNYELYISANINEWDANTLASPYTVVTNSFDECRLICDDHIDLCAGFQAESQGNSMVCRFRRRSVTQTKPMADTFCYGVYSDPQCSSGIIVGNICCHHSCGDSCTDTSYCGAGSTRENCCHGLIRGANKPCKTGTPPCLLGYTNGMSLAMYEATGIPTGNFSFLRQVDPYFGDVCRNGLCKCFFVFTYPPSYCLVGMNESFGPNLPPELWIWDTPIAYSLLLKDHDCRRGDVVRRSTNGWDALKLPSSDRIGTYDLQQCANQVAARNRVFFSWTNDECYVEYSESRLCLRNDGMPEFATANVPKRFGPLNKGDVVSAFHENEWRPGIANYTNSSSILFVPDNRDIPPGVVNYSQIRALIDPSGWKSSSFSFYEIPKPTTQERRDWDGIWSRNPASFDCCLACPALKNLGPHLFTTQMSEQLVPVTLEFAAIGLEVARNLDDCNDIRTGLIAQQANIANMQQEGCGLVGTIIDLSWNLGAAWVEWTNANGTAFTRLHRVGAKNSEKTDLLCSRAEEDCKSLCTNTEKAQFCAFRPKELSCSGYTSCDTRGAPGFLSGDSYIVWRRGTPRSTDKLSTGKSKNTWNPEEICLNCTRPGYTPAKASEERDLPPMYYLMVFGPMISGGCAFGYVFAAIWWIFIYMLHLAFLKTVNGLYTEDKEARQVTAARWMRQHRMSKIAPEPRKQIYYRN